MGTRTFTYDNNGNTTNEGLWSNTWNWRNQMTQSSRTGPTVTVTYAYDADGNRVSQVNGSLTLIYPNEYYSYTGTTHDRQIPLPGYGMVATSKYKISASTSAIAYHHHDHLGGEHVDTDSTGATLEYTLYSPYGATLKTSGTTGYTNVNKFTGKQVDKDTGFYYYGVRYYSANYGRFLSEDPVFLDIGIENKILNDPQALNSYSYARNNPIKYVDEDGKMFGSSLLLRLAMPIAAKMNAYFHPDPVAAKQQFINSLHSGDWMIGTIGVEKTGVSIGRSIITETRIAAAKGLENITSKFKPTISQLLDTGEKFLGKGYKEIGKNGSGVFRSLDESKQFRIDQNSLKGLHTPLLSHGHLEVIEKGKSVTNNHVIIKE
ncbi:TPA: hypothetical protein DEP96_02955 [Candidatus Uhrbacteria bacterium]|nr:hypothetical protein [Candidatus Uhrbacteria bacterium]